jgi:hypothetical protein
MSNEDDGRHAQIRTLGQQLETQRAQLDAMRGVPAAKPPEPLKPATLRKRPKRHWKDPDEPQVQRREAQAPTADGQPFAEATGKPRPTRKATKKARQAPTEVERCRRQVAYWQRRVREEERLFEEHPEPFANSDLAKARRRLEEAQINYADARGSRRASAPGRSGRSASGPKPAPAPQSLIDRVFGAIRRIF